MNPPGQEFCIGCHSPLTITAGADALEGTPESADELEHIEEPETAETPEMVVMGGIGGAPIPMPADRLDPDPDQPPRG
jgi:hypothetical protein